MLFLCLLDVDLCSPSRERHAANLKMKAKHMGWTCHGKISSQQNSPERTVDSFACPEAALRNAWRICFNQRDLPGAQIVRVIH